MKHYNDFKPIAGVRRTVAPPQNQKNLLAFSFQALVKQFQ